jgi:hypothetical protein
LEHLNPTEMKNSMLVRCTLTLALSFILSLTCFAQNKPGSPLDSCKGKIGSANITVVYSSPSVKERKIWGALVPYGEVWRAGANGATRLTTDHAIQIEGKTLPAGTYSFFTIPGESKWTIIFNKTARQWGSFKYDMKEDALRVDVKPLKSAAFSERLVYKISPQGLSLIWENLEVPLSFK